MSDTTIRVDDVQNVFIRTGRTGEPWIEIVVMDDVGERVGLDLRLTGAKLSALGVDKLFAAADAFNKARGPADELLIQD